MNFFLNKNGTVEFQGIDLFLETLLLDSFQPKRSEELFAKKDIFQKISQNSDETSSDWEKYSKPELLSLFGKCHKLVLLDLDKMSRQRSHPEAEVTLKIPSAHRDAWLRIISMARLTLAAKVDFISRLERSKNSIVEEKKLPELLFQQDFLALLLKCLIEAEDATH